MKLASLQMSAAGNTLLAFGQDGSVRLWNVAGQPGLDSGEPSWAVLAHLIRETTFVHVWRRLDFMKNRWSVPVDEYWNDVKADVAVCDPHASTPTQPFADTIRGADVVIVATNHSEFAGPKALRTIVGGGAEDCLVVDPWNALGTSQVFAYADEAAAMLGDAAHELTRVNRTSTTT